MALNPAYEFPQTAEEFFTDRPADMSNWGWLFHPANPHRFETYVIRLINLVQRLSARVGWTFARLSWFAKAIGISERWLREILRRLEVIGVIISRRVGRQKQYRLADGRTNRQTSALTSAIEPKIESATIAQSTVAGDQPAPTIRDQDLGNVDPRPIITTRAGDIGDDRSTDPIVRIFEQATGAQYRPDRDGGALAELKTYDPLAVEAGILETALRATSQINSLKYCLPQVRLIDSLTHQKPIAPAELFRNPTLRPTSVGQDTLQIIIKAHRIKLAKKRCDHRPGHWC